jgi:hypothetical protein
MSVEEKNFMALTQRAEHVETTLDKLMDVLIKASTLGQSEKTRIGQIRAEMKATSK